MAVDIGPRIGIEGEREYRQKLQEIIAGQKTLASEAKAVSAAMKDETDAEKKDAAQKDVLTRQILTQKEKLEELEKGLRASAKMHGEASVTTQKWQQAVYEAQATLSNMERELRGTDSQVEELSDDMRDAGQSAAGWADVMKGSLLADAVKSGLNWMKDTVQTIGSKIRDASKAGAAYADEILTISTVSGIGTEGLQAYAYMTDLVDVSLDTITGSMSKMTRSMASAVKGKGAAAEAWKKLNIGITNADGSMRKADDVFRDTLDALRKIKNPTERDAMAMEIFGRSAQELNPLISAGADRLEELRKEAHNTGYVLSGSALTALNKQQDAMDRLEKKAEALSNRFAVRLAPSVEKATGKLNDLADNPRVKRALDIMADGVGSVIDGALDLAEDVLPGLLSVFGLFDEKMRLFSDEELERSQHIDEMVENWGGLQEAFRDDATAAWDAKKKNEDLLTSLDNIVEADGKVKKGNEEIANQIVNELNKNLGLNITVIDGVIQKWGEVKIAAQDAINTQTAASLIAAGEQNYTEAKKNYSQNMLDTAKWQEEVDRKKAEIEGLEKEIAKIAAEQTAYKDKYGIQNDELEMKIGEMGSSLSAAREKLPMLQDELDKSQKQLSEYMDTIHQYDDARIAFQEGNTEQAISIMTREQNFALVYAASRRKLTEQEREELKQLYEEQAARVAYIQEEIANGSAVFREEDLQNEKKHLDDIYRANVEASLQWFDARSEENKARKEAERATTDAIIKDRRRFGKEAEDLYDGMIETTKRKGEYVRTEVERTTEAIMASAKEIMDGEAIANSYMDGLKRGLTAKSKLRELETAAAGTAETIVTATRGTLMIQSPSKVAAFLGEMWDAGLVKGMESQEGKLRQTSERLSGGIINGASGLSPSVGYYGGALAAPIGTLGVRASGSSYTTNLGGVNITVSGAGAVNEDVLARSVAIRLTQELNRSNRARGG